MTLRKTIEVVTKLAQTGVIENYAIAGAVAALNYLEPMLTEDLDILVSVSAFEKHSSGLLLLGPIEKALADMGYAQRTGVGVMVGDWPVQFLPVASPLDEEALERAVELSIEDAGLTTSARVLRPEHLVAIALKVRRPKDALRVDAFLGQDAVDLTALKDVLERHKLMEAWRTFCLKSGRLDPLR